jgi:hypothetical protein
MVTNPYMSINMNASIYIRSNIKEKKGAIYIPAAKTKSTTKKAIFMEDFSISSGLVNP